VRITDVRLRTSSEGDELTARLGDFVCRYQFPTGAVGNSTGDAFLAVGLLAAMVRGEPLELDTAFTASPTLLEGLGQLQEVLAVWVPALRRVPVIARTAPPPPARSGAAAFFSGGVDSLYTLLERKDEIAHAVHIRGFDYRRENLKLAAEIDGRNRAFLEARGKTLIIVESNLRDLYDAVGVHVHLYHGSHLGSVALALGFERIFVPASLTWAELLPWGSHPVTDPLWGNGAVRLVHHGMEAGRLKKLKRIAVDPGALALMRVCPGFSDYSCGVCEKCVRTRVALRLAGVGSPNLPPLEDVSAVRRLRIDSATHRLLWHDNLASAVLAGDRPLAKAIAVALARFDARQALRSLDRAFLGGRARRLVARMKGTLRRRPEGPDAIGPLPPEVERI
jgi:hypothetical protein